MRSIGIDIGTTNISTVVLDAQSRTVVKKCTVSNGSDLQTEHPWERTQDVQEICMKVLSAVDELLDEFEDIASIGLTGQMHGIVYVDEEGSAVSPLYTWQDGRGNLPEFDGKTLCTQLLERYNVKTSTGYGLVTHLYNVKKGLVPVGAASICTIADYIGMVLTGRRTPLVHISQAAALGLFDSKVNAFMTDVIADAGIDVTILPRVTTEFDVLGEYQGIPVAVSVGDNQASFIGSVEDEENAVLVNVGTGAQISVLSRQHFAGQGIEARPLTRDKFLLVGATICGGSAYAALEQFFRAYAVAAGAPDQPQYGIMQRLLEEQNGEERWKVKTTFAGTRENPDETGAVSGISTANFLPAAFIKGVLNGMAEELHELYRVIEGNVCLKRTKLIASGNGVRQNETLQTILANCFGMELTVVQNEEEAASGAAITALAAMGNHSEEM